MNEKWMKMRQSQEEGDFSSPTAKKEKYVCFHNINQTLPALMTKGKQKKKFLKTDYHFLIENTKDKRVHCSFRYRKRRVFFGISGMEMGSQL